MARPSAKGLGQLSSKHLAVDKANSKVIIAAAVATAILIFSIFAGLALVDKIAYQNEVINERQKANKQLEDNIKSIDLLNNSFIAFDSTTESAIGTADKNSKIVLDSLPSKYDFPALTSSIEYIVAGAGMKLSGIRGIDQEAVAEQGSIDPKPIEMPLDIQATGNYDGVKKLITDLSRSIRPFYISAIQIKGEDSNLEVSLVLKTYYQPGTEVGITEEVVKTGDSAPSTAPEENEAQ